jgi:hypothetical protein
MSNNRKGPFNSLRDAPSLQIFLFQIAIAGDGAICTDFLKCVCNALQQESRTCAKILSITTFSIKFIFETLSINDI